jgi:AcrR family transcriptional regulator
VTEGSKDIRRRRSIKGENRREAILDAGMRIFARDGFTSASIQSVAKEVGLSLPGLLHHFPTKVDLLLAILERRDVNSLALMEGGTGDWRDALANLKRINRANAEVPSMIRTFSLLNAESLIEDHPAAEWFAERAIMVRMVIVDILERGKARGEICTTIIAEDIAAEIISMMDGMQMLWLRDQARTDMIRMFDTFIDRLIADLSEKR